MAKTSAYILTADTASAGSGGKDLIFHRFIAALACDYHVCSHTHPSINAKVSQLGEHQRL
jgi:hypothetical protein